ncbi:glycosyltransferase family 4 protein [Terriglobus saanensis]|uniref:Glycosyl transferase group 1 n=1 Tax=Terriglobus saanensis (strain ATCC BAA-1853 / DSM 23119 / SP1PR4) TaxID=401053 RepID=E8V6L5_TERSS|nr:glycosyltransferase family 4 protein [Terriglobus saanensis]ADV82754.1 glycosyl transferase group 1 [Terriglobus saanensis SP1PR4]
MPTQNRKQRILYVDQTAALGGGELALLSLIKQLDRTRFEPIVILFQDGPFVEKLQGICEVRVVLLDASVQEFRKDAIGIRSILSFEKLKISLAYVVGLVRTIRRLRPDIIHTNSLKADLLGGLAAKLLRIPLIWHVRDRIADDYLPSRTVKVFRSLCRIFPNYIIANSQSTLETLFLPPGKPFSVISSGFDVERFRALGSQQASLRDTMRDGGTLNIGIVGRISPWKGQEVFAEAISLVRKEFPGVKAPIIGAALFGEQEFEVKLRDLVRDLGLNDVIQFKGFQHDVASAIGHLHMLIHASVIPEPLGQVIAQGMAAGKPVVATRGGGASEIVQDGVTGLLVPAKDHIALAEAILSLLRDPEKAEQMALRGQQFAIENFAEASITRRVEAVYDTMIR